MSRDYVPMGELVSDALSGFDGRGAGNGADDGVLACFTSINNTKKTTVINSYSFKKSTLVSKTVYLCAAVDSRVVPAVAPCSCLCFVYECPVGFPRYVS